MALGAGRAPIFRIVVGESALLVAVGVVFALPGALGATRLISAQLYGLKPADPGTMAGAILLLAGVAAFASYIPARRATQVDPMVALRYE